MLKFLVYNISFSAVGSGGGEGIDTHINRSDNKVYSCLRIYISIELCNLVFRSFDF